MARRAPSPATRWRCARRRTWSTPTRDLALPPLQRAFIYLPFEHAEDDEMQVQSVGLFTRLAQVGPEFAGMLDFAHRHRDVIKRFGRFPHRNAMLGRASTAEEQAFLLQPGSGF
ncbi:DUF924 family protein [Rugamonas sp. DEMB1]|uniref:DUF924 family protein n=1 Tax=Rugamonas sp. DEMB1 TaxID=3039386 RepID=UPI0028BD64EF|nr:DUF924 family protein [Rugamonas sp. DEMB1]